MRHFILAAMAALFFAGSANAAHMAETMNERIDFLFGDKASKRYEPFIRSFQAAVQNNDPVAVSRFIAYPMLVRLGARTVRLRSARDFIRYYPEIFTRKMRRTLVCQDYETLFANWQGVMFGHGAVWIAEGAAKAQSGKTVLKVIAIHPDGAFKDERSNLTGSAFRHRLKNALARGLCFGVFF